MNIAQKLKRVSELLLENKYLQKQIKKNEAAKNAGLPFHTLDEVYKWECVIADNLREIDLIIGG